MGAITELISGIPGLEALYFLDIFRKDKKKKNPDTSSEKEPSKQQ